jgi:hypothetical protein
MLYPYIVIGKDGGGNPLKYAIQHGTYIRKWTRQFTLNLSANIVEVPFIDNGPGLRVYAMTLELATWDPTSLMYQSGITASAETQMSNLEAQYLKKASSLYFLDPFGIAPTFSGGDGGIYFTMMNQIIPDWSTSQKPYIQVQIELTESKSHPI